MRILLLATLLVSPVALIAQAPPTVLHGQISTQPVGQGLAARIDALKQEKTPLWVGYQIPVEHGFHIGSNASSIAYLEGDRDSWTKQGSYGQDLSFDHATLLLRLADGEVQRLRVESPQRQLDAGGLRFVWLTGVTPADSVSILRSLVIKGGVQKLRQEAVFFISLHQGPEATAALIDLAAPDHELALREKASFWLANQRGHEGFLALQRLARSDADAQFREKLAFDLTLAHEPAALDELVHMAHDDASPQVRRQAQFWMASKASKDVSADLVNSAENDPNTDVRKSAVFALSRLPGDEAATQLMRVADTSKDAAVRKQAVFWLGQSHDPRALDYLARLIQR